MIAKHKIETRSRVTQPWLLILKQNS